MKKCKGTGKAKGHGCGISLPFSERNGLKTYKAKYGLGIDCGCFSRWIISDSDQANEVFDSFLISHKKKFQDRKPISKLSRKRKAQEVIYSQLRKVFLNKEENKVCPIYGTRTTDIHHKKGRIGNLLINTKYWVALSREAHIFVEQNPIWAKENGYSLNRLDND